MALTRETKILLYGANLWYFGEGMLGPLFAVFAGKVGGNILEISWTWALYLAIMGIMTIIIGHLSDTNTKIRKEKLLVFGYFLNALFTFGYLFVSSPKHLFLVQAGLGIASAFAIPTWSSLFSLLQHQKKAGGYLWGLAGGQGQLVTAAAIVLGGLIVNYFSFKTLFLIMGTVQVLAAFFQARILKKQ